MARSHCKRFNSARSRKILGGSEAGHQREQRKNPMNWSNTFLLKVALKEAKRNEQAITRGTF